MWKMVRPLTFMSCMTVFGVALSPPPSLFTTEMNLSCKSGVHLSLHFGRALVSMLWPLSKGLRTMFGYWFSALRLEGEAGLPTWTCI